MEKEFDEKDNIKKKSKKELDRMLAYGSIGLGLNQASEDNKTEDRIKEDIKNCR